MFIAELPKPSTTTSTTFEEYDDKPPPPGEESVQVIISRGTRAIYRERLRDLSIKSFRYLQNCHRGTKLKSSFWTSKTCQRLLASLLPPTAIKVTAALTANNYNKVEATLERPTPKASNIMEKNRLTIYDTDLLVIHFQLKYFVGD